MSTFRSHRKLNLSDVVKAKLEINVIVSRKSNTGVVIMEWKDKKDVFMLTSVYIDKKVEVQSANKRNVDKPETLIK